jgi:hypothetical protein
MKIYDVKQGTPEWLALRVGKLTGSKLKDVMMKDNLGLIDEMIAESGCGFFETSFVSYDMQVGIEREPIARELYSAHTGNIVNEVGFIVSDKHDFIGCSPDGIIYNDLNPGNERTYGALEIKCPRPKTHCKYIRMNCIPNEYKYQVMNYFLCVEELEWLDFVSFNPDFKPQPLFIFRIYRSELKDELISLEADILKFWDKLNKYKSQILF